MLRLFLDDFAFAFSFSYIYIIHSSEMVKLNEWLDQSATYFFILLFNFYNLIFTWHGCSNRMEKLVLKSKSTQAKIMGTVVSISGAMLVVLYKGPVLLTSGSPSSSSSLRSVLTTLASSPSNWIIGGLLLTVENLLKSIWFIIQVYIHTDIHILLIISILIHNIYVISLGKLQRF